MLIELCKYYKRLTMDTRSAGSAKGARRSFLKAGASLGAALDVIIQKRKLGNSGLEVSALVWVV